MREAGGAKPSGGAIGRNGVSIQAEQPESGEEAEANNEGVTIRQLEKSSL